MSAFTVKVVPYHSNHHVSKGAAFILEASVPVSSLWHSFHSVTTTAQQVVFADKSSSSMQTAGNYVNLAPVKPIARFLLQHIFP